MPPTLRSARAEQQMPQGGKETQVHQDLVRAGLRLMLSGGYGPTSIDEVCAAAKVSKGAFFHYFSSKEALAEEVLELYSARVLARLEEVRDAQPPGPRRLSAELRFLIDAAEQGSLRQGCLLGNFAQALSRSHPKLRACCARHLDRLVSWFEQELSDASEGRLARAEARLRAEQVIIGLEGALILAKATGSSGAVRRTLERAEQEALAATAAPLPPRTRRKKE